jgi:hypothetical protein
MELERGNSENLVGNAVVYWDVEGENYLNPGSRIIASNFVISAIPLEDKLFTATFPPISFKNHDDFMAHLVNVHCDIIYGGKLKFPPKESDFKKFLKHETVKYNKIIEEYTDKYKLKFDFDPSRLSEKEQLYLLEDLSKKIRISVAEGKYIDGDIDSNPTKVLKIIKNLKNKFDKYDIDNFINFLYQPGEDIDNLTNLYTKKFLAIYYEDYENAKDLSEQIKNIETHIK